MSDDERTRPWAAQTRSAAEIARDGVPEVEFDVDGLLESTDGPTIIFAEPGAFKTWLALFVAAAVLNGALFLGKHTTRKRPWVIYVNLDAGRLAIERRIALMGIDDDRFITVSPEAWDRAQFEELLEHYPGALVVIDCMADAFEPSAGEDMAVATRRFLRDLRKIFERHGANGFLIDHANRGSGNGRGVNYYGSVQRKAAIRSMWALERVQDGDAPTSTIEVRCEKPNDAPPFAPFRVNFNFADGAVTIRPVEIFSSQATAEKLEALEARLLDWGHEQAAPFSKNGAERAVPGRAGDKRAAFAKLLKRGAIVPTGTKRNGSELFLLAPSTSSGTRSDEVDEVRVGPSADDFVPQGFTLGGRGLGTRFGTRSSGMCLGCQSLGELDDQRLCRDCSTVPEK